MDFHLLVRLVVLLAYVVLKACIVSLIFVFEYVDIKDVVPKEVLVASMMSEVNRLLLKCLSADITDVAVVFFIIGPWFAFFSETREGVKHESTHDVAEHRVEECDVDDIVDEADYFKLLHGLADRSWNVELTHTIQHSIAHRSWVIFWRVNVFHVITKGHCAEDYSKHYSHYADEDQRFQIENCWL